MGLEASRYPETHLLGFGVRVEPENDEILVILKRKCISIIFCLEFNSQLEGVDFKSYVSPSWENIFE